MKIISLAIVVALSTCKSTSQDSSEKSIVDAQGRVFGLIASPGQGPRPTKFEFRLCNGQINRRPMEMVIHDPAVCVNPYLDVVARPLVITGQTFDRIDDAEASLKSRGFRKGAAAAVGGGAVGVAGGIVIGLASGVAAAVAIGTTVETGTMLTLAGASAAGAGSGGMLGYSVWGANDRDTGNNIAAVMSDFHRQKKANDVIRILRTFGEEMNWTISNDVNRF